MSIAHRRTKLVADVIDSLVAEGRSTFRAGDIAERLRQQAQPLGIWEIRGELSNLEAEGRIQLDPASGCWQPAAAPSRKVG